MKKLLFGMIFILGLTGCDRENNPVLGNPPANVTQISMSIPQIDTAEGSLNRVFLSITDGSGNPQTNLRMGNLSVTEGGKPGVPVEFGVVTEPLFLVLAIDRSGSMSGSNTTAANNAATDLINALSAGDYAAIVDFATEVTIRIGFTSSKSSLIAALDTEAEGGTSLYDAAIVGSGLLTTQNGRRLMIILTDGADTASSATAEESIRVVNANGQSMYTVGLGSGFEADVLQYMAQATGGTYDSSVTGADLSTIFLEIIARFDDLFYLRYHRKARGGITVYLNYGAFTGQAGKSLD